ncbi:MAG: hypothetical protein FWC65_01565 [Treponema sp.]|nr:hypothetical protein [Treponema sp.]
MGMCWHCGSAITDKEPLGRSLSCSDCGKDLRSCKNCRHCLPSGCAERAAEHGGEKPSDPDRANFCGWFSLNPRLTEATEGEKKSLSAASAAKSAFDGLFK